MTKSPSGEFFDDTEPKLPLFEIDSNGGYVTQLTDLSGKNILFPKKDIDGRTRGGSHVCLPCFGPDASGKHTQHGFGRDAAWLKELDSPKDIRLVLPSEGLPEGYEDMKAAIQYHLEPNSLSTALIVNNFGTTPLHVAPGFHPYFALDEHASLNGEEVSLGEFQDPKVIVGNRQTLDTNGHRITLTSKDFHTWVVWTDLRGGYLCVEPTLNGPGFDSQHPKENELVPPQQVSSYSYKIEWESP